MSNSAILNTENGLSTEEVKLRQEKYGYNQLPEKKPPTKISIFLSQLKNPLVFVLLGASIVTILIGQTNDALIILIAVFINTILGFVQENKTSNSLAALKKFISIKATVLRDGERMQIDTKEIVPGDIVFLNRGDKIPADGVLISTNRFSSNEAVLTGESLPISKNVDDKVFVGTSVSSGQAVVLVQSIGSATEVGKIADKIQDKDEITPFQVQLKTFSNQLLIIIGAIILFVFIVGLIRGMDITEIFITSVALAVSSIPEGLLVSLTIVLTIGMQKILKRRGLVRKLAAAETLGGVSVICTDKTGTLTLGQTEVSDFKGDQLNLATQLSIANDLDDPVLISGYKWAKNLLKDDGKSYNRIDSIPFTSKEKFFISLNEWDENNNIIFVNGAPELLLSWSTLNQSEKDKVIEEIENLTNEGKRIIGFGRKFVDKNKKSLELEDAKGDLEWVGIVAFSDPVREGLIEPFRETYEAGIKTVVITGDYPKTSIYVLSQLGVTVSEDEYITGDVLSAMSDEELKNRIDQIKLFARTTPDQKLRIVNAFKEKGEVVAMIGDGVNDAPALHRSDIGIVVNNASDVARETADLVLLDSSFSTIVHAIEEGRAMFENIRKIVLYLLCDAFEEILVVLAGIIIGLPLPVTAVQILWVNLVSDGLPNLALTVDPKRRDIMKDKPRSPDEHIITSWMINLILFVSFFAGLVAFLSFYFVYKNTGNITLARSVTFVTIGINSLVYVFSVRAPFTSFIKSSMFKNKWLGLSVLAGFGLQFLPFATETFRNFFKVEKISVTYWGVAFGLSILMFLAVEMFKHIFHANIVKSHK
jgi:Ca2+-transporting ATPase